jgi:hypothetical protein
VKTFTQIAATFPYQSFLDDTLLETAINLQSPGSLIVDTDDTPKRNEQTAGIGVALHPSSETPIAIRFFGPHESGVIILTPGSRMITGPFDRFEWGLPFGWLGGGTALLYVLHEPDVDLGFSTDAPDILFHRQRLLIGADFTPDPLPDVNWPVAFPWSNAFSGAQPQASAAILPMQPTWTLLRLRVASVAPVTLYGVYRATNDLDTDDVGVSSTTDSTTIEISFPGVPAGFPLAWIEDPVTRLGGKNTIFYLVDPLDVQTGEFVDAVRYGKVR